MYVHYVTIINLPLNCPIFWIKNCTNFTRNCGYYFFCFKNSTLSSIRHEVTNNSIASIVQQFFWLTGHPRLFLPVFRAKKIKNSSNLRKSNRWIEIDFACSCASRRSGVENSRKSRSRVQRDVSTLGPIGSNEAARVSLVKFRLLNAVNRRGGAPPPTPSDNRHGLALARSPAIFMAHDAAVNLFSPAPRHTFSLLPCTRSFRFDRLFRGVARNSRSGRVHPPYQTIGSRFDAINLG